MSISMWLEYFRQQICTAPVVPAAASRPGTPSWSPCCCRPRRAPRPRDTDGGSPGLPARKRAAPEKPSWSPLFSGPTRRITQSDHLPHHLGHFCPTSWSPLADAVDSTVHPSLILAYACSRREPGLTRHQSAIGGDEFRSRFPPAKDITLSIVNDTAAGRCVLMIMGEPGNDSAESGATTHSYG
jgi:hypothetical protein